MTSKVIEKDETKKERTIVVAFKTFHVTDMLANEALKECGLKLGKNVKVIVDCRMTSKDSLGYERQTETLAVGARVTIIVDTSETEEKTVEP